MNQNKHRLFLEPLNPHFGYYYTTGKTLYSGKTPFQKIRFVETEEFGKVLQLDDITQVVEKNDYQYHEPMVHPACCSHPRPRDCLVIGGGDGGILRECLKYPTVRSIQFAELDKQVITFSRTYLQSIHCGAFDDPRVSIHTIDGREFVRTHPQHFDVVIMDMTDPFGPSAMLYTREFFREVSASFQNEKGLFVMHGESPVSRPEAFACIATTLRSVFPYVGILYVYIQMYAVLWSICVCSNTIDIGRISAATIARRLHRYGIDGLKVYTPHTHHAMQAVYPYVQELLDKGGRIITDDSPQFPDHFYRQSGHDRPAQSSEHGVVS